MYQFVHSSEAERPVVLLGEGCGVVTEPLAETMEMWNKSNVVLVSGAARANVLCLCH